MSQKHRLIEPDYIRAISMLGVIVIHVSSTFVNAQSNLMIAGMNPAFILNQVVRFAVPLFILLSGLSLGFGKTNLSYPAFLKSRCIKILIPYLIWSSLYWLVYHKGQGFSAFAKALLRGGAASHLYFIIIMLQLYLLYPLLKKAVRRFPAQSVLVSLAISFIAHQALRHSGAGLFVRGPILQRMWFLFPTWLVYFVLGMALHQLDFERLCSWCSKNLWFLLILTAVCAGFYARESRLTGNLDSIKVSLFIYTPLVLLTILAIGHRLRNCTRLNRAVSFLARHSQTVFFSHLFILSYLRRFPVLVTGIRGTVLLLFAETILSVLCAWLIDSAIGQIKKKFLK